MDRRHLSALQLRWAQEVHHLHSLWHLGPPPNPNPNPNPNTYPNPNPNPNLIHNPNPNLRPNQTAHFKKPSKKKNKNRNTNSRTTLVDGNPENEIVEKEWPVGPTLPKPTDISDWGSFVPALVSEPKPLTADELAHSAAVQIHSNSLKASRDFFSKKAGSDSENDDIDDDDEDEEDEEEVLKFFINVFVGDCGLREYYEKNGEKGEFYCLVCEGTGMKKWKKYVDCVALVQHANSISKMKRRVEHRAFAMAVCRVLGWDFKRLPSIVLDMGKRLGETISKGEGIEVGVEKNVVLDDTNKLSNHAVHDGVEKGAEKLGETEDDAGKDAERLGEPFPKGSKNEVDPETEDHHAKQSGSEKEHHVPQKEHHVAMQDDAEEVDNRGMQDDTDLADNPGMLNGTEKEDHHAMQGGTAKEDNAMLDGVEHSVHHVEQSTGKEDIMNQQQILEDNAGQQHILGHNIEEIKEETGYSNSLFPEMTTTETLTMEPEVNLTKDETQNEVVPDQQKDSFGNEVNLSDRQL